MTQPNGSSLLTLSRTLAGSPYPRIKDVAAGHGVDFGMAVRAAYLSDSLTGPMVANECSIIVPEYEMQASVTQPTSTTWNLTALNTISDFAVVRSQKLKGHSLFWHHADLLPDWQETILALADNAQTRTLITNRTAGFAGFNFEGGVDVVNEPIAAGSSGYRTTSPWYIGWGGIGYVQFAFEEARRLLPVGTPLGFNEFGMENVASTDNDGKRAQTLTLATDLANLGLMDYFGCQTHVFSGASYQSSLEQTFRPFLASMRALGVKVHLSELDYRSTATRGTNEELDAYAQDRLKRVVGTWAENMQEGEHLIVWGIKDDQSWLQDPANNGGITQQRPLPWDSNGNPKTMERMLRRIFL
jgi:endo-1,4-beta-xylanase